MWRVLGRLGVDRSDVPDVAQEVFLVVHRRLADYDGRAPVRAWIYGICVRQAADYRRSIRRRGKLPDEALPQRSSPADQEHELELGRARARLFAVLETLDPDKREVFVLYELERLPMSEVARIVDCPVQTAYSRLHAARKLVLAAFEAPGPKSEAV